MMDGNNKLLLNRKFRNSKERIPLAYDHEMRRNERR